MPAPSSTPPREAGGDDTDAVTAAPDHPDVVEDRALYEESYHPPFLWALALIPPLLPLFWYVPFFLFGKWVTHGPQPNPFVPSSLCSLSVWLFGAGDDWENTGNTASK